MFIVELRNKRNAITSIGYLLFLVILTVFTWGLVDVHLPFKAFWYPPDFMYAQKTLVAVVYSVLVVMLFLFYARFLWLVKAKRIKKREIVLLVGTTIAVLFLAYPAFSYDIFNYIATAKLTFFYKENPYVTMPIEISNEPMLAFMHAANKTALYGPVWIILTAIPHFMGLQNLLLTIFTFKMFILIFYLGLIWVIWCLSERNLLSVTFFALNPLVILETLVSAHNDVVMMFFALLSFYWLRKRKFILSCIVLVLSIFIKFSTFFLIPVYFFLVYQMIRKKKIDWNAAYFWSAIAMYVIFLLSPIREEIYSWYLIWPLTFVSFLSMSSFLSFVSLGFSFGLLFRIAPFLYTQEWGGITPTVKRVATFIPPFLASMYYAIRKKI